MLNGCSVKKLYVLMMRSLSGMKAAISDAAIKCRGGADSYLEDSASRPEKNTDMKQQ